MRSELPASTPFGMDCCLESVFFPEAGTNPPDIDLDIEHRRREEVIQHVYSAYGRDNAAQVANVISYRPRMALPDAGAGSRLLDRAAERLVPAGQAAAVRARPAHPPDVGVPEAVTELAEQMQRLPRHLGIHSGGMVICDRPVGECARWNGRGCRAAPSCNGPRMTARTRSLVEFDLLGLGMLTALRDCFELVARHHDQRWSLHSIHQEDPGVYDMLCEADTVGVFQVESRAQVPGADDADRHRLRGLHRHRGGQAAAGDELQARARADRGTARPLLDGMAARGIPAQVAEDIYLKILAFSSYGFPESHAISFAYLVYASAWLKCYYPAAFTAALLRAQPMGPFYAPASLISDVAQARRAGARCRRERQRRPGHPGRARNYNAPHSKRPAPRPSRHPSRPAIRGAGRCRASQPSRIGLSEVRALRSQVAAAIVALPAVRGSGGLRPAHHAIGPGHGGTGDCGRVRLFRREPARGAVVGRRGRHYFRPAAARHHSGTDAAAAAGHDGGAGDLRGPVGDRRTVRHPSGGAHPAPAVGAWGVLPLATCGRRGREQLSRWADLSRTGSSRGRPAGWCS